MNVARPFLIQIRVRDQTIVLREFWYNEKMQRTIWGWLSLVYFTLPGNERYYDFTWGPVHFFALDSDPNESDGITPDSVQGQWLQAQLAASTSPWNLVYTHFDSYTTSASKNKD